MRIEVTNNIVDSPGQTRAYAEYRVFADLAAHSRIVPKAEVLLESSRRRASHVICTVRAGMASGEVVRVRAEGRHAYDAINRAASRIAKRLREHAAAGSKQRPRARALSNRDRTRTRAASAPPDNGSDGMERLMNPQTAIDPHEVDVDARTATTMAAPPRSMTFMRERGDTTMMRRMMTAPHIRAIGVAVDERDRRRIVRKVARTFGKFASSIERVSVRLSDANGPKGGDDLTARIKVVLGAHPSVVVEQRDSVLHRAIDRAVKAAARAIGRTVDRRRLKPLHHRGSRGRTVEPT